jgi:hypothetical protein
MGKVRAHSHQSHEGVTVVLLLLDTTAIADGVGAKLLAHAISEVHDSRGC